MIDEIQSSADIERLIEPLKDMIAGIISAIGERKSSEFIIIEAVDEIQQEPELEKCEIEVLNCEKNAGR